jgi:hypothetical protein
VPTDAIPQVRLYHSNILNQETVYNLTLKVTDSDGASTTQPMQAKVVRTQFGALYTSEYWSGTHRVTGELTVPAFNDKGEPVLLELAAGMTIIVETGDDSGLHIAGELITGAGVTFRKDVEDYMGYWKGIFITGTADLSYCNIQDAVRGVIVGPASDVILTGTSFIGNRVGVHVFKDGQLMTGCNFMDSDIWGVKEEGVHARVMGGMFEGNLMDYYGYDNPRMTMEQLNARDDCDGNISN